VQWLKQNLVIVILSVVIVASIPVAWFIASGMNKKVRESQQSAVVGVQRDLTAASVTYLVPAALPGDRPIELRSAPNRILTEWFQAERERVAGDAIAVVQRAVAFNRSDHRPLVEGLFPSAGSAQRTQRLMTDFRRAVLGDARTPSIYARLIAQHRGGDRADLVRLYDALRDLQERETERLRLERGAAGLDADDGDEIRARLSERRMSEYRRRGREVSFYATPDIFFMDQGQASRFSQQWRLASVANQADTFDAFLIQWDMWVFRDILRAVARANTDPDGQPTPIERSVVKRIERLAVEDLPVYGETVLADMPSEAVSEDGLAPTDRRHSLTGRLSTAENQVYDVRTAELVAIVSSERLPQFFRALRETNYMTVLEITTEPVDAWEELTHGFYYGEEHVVRATMRIETVWLRSWTAPLMPEGLRAAMGVQLVESGGE